MTIVELIEYLDSHGSLIALRDRDDFEQICEMAHAACVGLAMELAQVRELEGEAPSHGQLVLFRGARQ